MRIKSKSKSKRIILIVTVTCLFAVGIIFVVSQSINTDNIIKTDHSNTNMSSKTTTQDSAENTSNQLEAKKTPTNTDQPVTPTDQPGSTKQQVPLVVSVDVDSNTVDIRGGVNYPVPLNGRCYANLSHESGKNIQRDTSLLQNPGSTDCKTITLPLNELTAGSWVATLHYASDNFEGVSNEVAFTIN